MGLPPLTRDYSSLEIHVFTVQNINTLTPLVSVYTLHCSTASRKENSQISLWIPQDQSSWECLQAENVFEYSSPSLNCFWKCLKHKIAGKSKPLKELWGETLIYSIERYWNILLAFPWEITVAVAVVGYGGWESEEPGSCHQLALSKESCLACLVVFWPLEGMLWDIWEKWDTEKLVSS